MWHLWYSKRVFSAPLLSHCHKLQPPTKRHDSASYLFTVNNACGAGLMFPGNEYCTRQAYIRMPMTLQQKTATPDHERSASPRTAQGCLLSWGSASRRDFPVFTHFTVNGVLMKISNPKCCWDSEVPHKTSLLRPLLPYSVLQLQRCLCYSCSGLPMSIWYEGSQTRHWRCDVALECQTNGGFSSWDP